MDAVVLSNAVLLVCAMLVVAGTVSSLVAARFGAPILLVFLLVGIIAGEDGPGGIHFSDFWATYMVGSAALAVILFDGGLRTRVSSMRGAIAPALLLSTVGVLATAGLVALVAVPLFDLTVPQGMLVGAIVASTDAAAVLFLVRAQGLKLGRRLDAVIEIESATNDPAAVFLTVLLVEIISTGSGDFGWAIVTGVMREMSVGAVMGVLGGFALAAFLNRVDLPVGLQPVLVVAWAVLVFALTSLFHGSGFLAVYLAGLILGNRPVRGIAGITSFHDAITWLCQIVMFTMLGLLLTPHTMLAMLPAGIALAAFLIFVARPAVVFACLSRFGFSTREKVFVSWAGLRGAVSIFLATIPMLAQLPLAPLYFNIAFIVVFVSLVLHGTSLAFAARRLDVALAEPMREPQRFEIDLPGQSEHELVGYSVPNDLPPITPALLPDWARPVLVVRGGHILSAADAGPLVGRDYVYLLVPPKRVQQLDRVFMAEMQTWEDDAAFPFTGDVRIGDVADLYGLPALPGERQMTIADAFADRADERVAPGMRIAFGHAFIEVRTVEHGRVAQVALRFARSIDLDGEGPRWRGRARRLVSRATARIVGG